MRVLILHLWWQILHEQSITSSWMSRIMTPPLSRACGCRNRTVVSRLFNALLVSFTGSQIMPGLARRACGRISRWLFWAIPARAFISCQPIFGDNLKTGFHRSTFLAAAYLRRPGVCAHLAELGRGADRPPLEPTAMDRLKTGLRESGVDHAQCNHHRQRASDCHKQRIWQPKRPLSRHSHMKK
jgi:hypothetical protein